jgi:hypothetical protein
VSPACGRIAPRGEAPRASEEDAAFLRVEFKAMELGVFRTVATIKCKRQPDKLLDVTEI